MRIMSSAIERLLFTMCACLSAGIHAQTLNENRLEAYRAEYKDAATPVKYLFVHADGSPCCGAGDNTKAYLANITASAPAKLAHSPEIDKLFNENFEVEIDNESVLSGSQGDFFVLTMSRPAEYNPKYVPCAGGMGESRAYLISVSGSKATVIDRNFGGCGRDYKVINAGGEVGYEVSDNSNHAKAVRYLLHGNNIVRHTGNR
jgi:hypothetical protein